MERIGVRLKSFVLLLLFPLLLLGKEVKYEVFYGFFPAGEIKIVFEPQEVVVKGKSSGLLGLFYKYRLYMVYNLRDPQRSFMEERENGKERRYDYWKILKKKPWLPLVIKLLLTHRGFTPNHPIKVDGLEIIPKKVEGYDYTFEVKGSKRVKRIELYGWKEGEFPRRIVVEGSAGTLVLVRD